MSKIVHILNGDSTAYSLSKAAISGDVIVWREMLSDGTLDAQMGSTNFWEKRILFFKDEFGISEEDYRNRTIDEIQKIEKLDAYNEVVLWFEFDLFCQVNLMALCSYLLQNYKFGIKYSLICTGGNKESEKLLSLSDFHFEDYQGLFDNRIELSKNDLEYAQECWKTYVSNDKERIAKHDFNQNKKFRYLQEAINQHMLRFSENSNGLNQIDKKILEIIHAGNSNKRQIIKELLLWQKDETIYGFGDLQYYRYLKNLKDYIMVSNDTYALNSAGVEMIIE